MLDRSAIAARIPHHGSMCLLDRVVSWSESSIQCTASNHRHSDNPLREGGRLGVAAGIEYAAQAMAVHGGLLTGHGQPPRQGYLASVRGVRFHALRLDDQNADLEINAERVSGDARQVLYRFIVSAAGQALLDGRAAVILDAEGL